MDTSLKDWVAKQVKTASPAPTATQSVPSVSAGDSDLRSWIESKVGTTSNIPTAIPKPDPIVVSASTPALPQTDMLGELLGLNGRAGKKSAADKIAFRETKKQEDEMQKRQAELLQEQQAALHTQLEQAQRDSLKPQPTDGKSANDIARETKTNLKTVNEQLREIDPSLVDPTFGERVAKTFSGAAKGTAGTAASAAGTLGQWGQANAEGDDYNLAEGAFNVVDDDYRERMAAEEERSKALVEKGDSLAEESTIDLARAKQGAGKVGQFAVDAGAAGIQLAGDMLLAALGGGGLATAGLAVRSFGGAAQDARADGADINEQMAYASAVAAKDIILNKLLGGLGRVYDKSTAGKAIAEMVEKRISNPQTRRTMSMVLNALSEGGEEALESAAGNALKSIYNDKGAWDNITEAELGDYLYEALIGAVLGGATEGLGGLADSRRSRVNTNTEVNAEQTAPTETAPIEAPTPEAKAEPTAEEIVAEILSGTVSNSQARQIMDSPELKDAFYALTGERVVGTNSEQRNIIKEASQTARIEAETEGDNEIAPNAAESGTEQAGELNSALAEYDTRAAEAFADETEDLLDMLLQNGSTRVSEAPAASPALNVQTVVQTTRATPTVQTQAAQNVKADAATEKEAAPPLGGDIVPTQTNSSDPLYTAEERLVEGLRPEDSVHLRHTDKAVDAEAERRYASDKDGERTYLFESGEAWTDTDTALAHRFLSEAVAEARKTGDYSEVVKLQREWERQGTAEGQALRQRGRFVNTPEAVIAEAANILYGENSQTRKLSPKRKAGIMDEVAKYAKEYNSIPAGDTQSVVDMIKRLNEVRRTTGLFSKTTSKMMSWALEQVAAMPDGDVFLRDVLATQIRSVASDYANPGILNQIKQVRFLNMLSKISTVARNLVANNILDPMETLATDIAVPFDILLSKFTGTRSVAVDKSWFSEAKRQGTTEGFIKSFIQEGLDANIEDVNTKYEQGKGRAFKMTGNFLERFLSTWEKYESFALKTTDEAQKGGIRAETQRGIDSLAERGLANADELSERADAVALDRTLQNRGKLVQAVAGTRNAWDILGISDSAGGHIGVGETAVPFAMVPVNATIKATQYTPAGLADTAAELGRTLIAAKKGELTAEQQAKLVTSLGRTLTGVGLTALSTVAALKGIIKVGGSDDKDEEAVQKGQRVSGTQINLSALVRFFKGESAEWQDGDELMDIGFAEQLNANFALGAAIADAYKDDGDVGLGDIARMNATAILRAVYELPAISTISGMVDAYRYSDAEDEAGKFADAAIDFGANTATSFLIPNALRGVASGLDNTVRNTYTADSVLGQAADYAQSGIPKLRSELPAALDSWGQEKTYTDSDFLNFLNSNVLPGKITQYKTNAVIDELSRLSDAGYEGIYPERKAPASISYEGEKISLDAEAQDKYLKKMGGLTEEYYREFLESPVYSELTDEVRSAVYKELQSLAESTAKEQTLKDAGLAYEANKIARLSDPVEYLTAKTRYSIATPSKGERDYDAIDALIGDLSGLSFGTQQKLKEDSDIKALIDLKGEVGAESYFTAKDNIANLQTIQGKTGNASNATKLQGIAGAMLPAEEEAALIDSLIDSKSVSAIYDLFIGAKYNGNDVAKYYNSVDANGNGSLTKAEVQSAMAAYPAVGFDAVWAILYPPKKK